ncbi:signal peptidase I [Glaciibacter psychrotolerans]|uniref:Signal peptidase I n=1 Tax=Glaciibacter psychrotolerans TaxID=670054 RepID=A0A7Z0EEB5_9MICO|nr:signal peptidase I [Leifsonia psychrotolerans]NYJ19906.1 signal peptidase I [Leifsonia psychrotolerans]
MTDPGPLARRPSGWLLLRDLAVIVVVALLISTAVKTFLIRPFYIPSASMQNTLQIDDRIIVNELVPALIPISRGDIVVFRDPAHWLGPSTTASSGPRGFLAGALTAVGLGTADSSEHLIKRVIGLAGDTVTCCTSSGAVSVNGVALDEPYIVVPPGKTKATPRTFTATVPTGSLWVMGDNRYHSADSSFHFTTGDPGSGFVPQSTVVGRAVLVSWPSANWGWLDNYPDTFRSVAPPR